MSLLPLPQAGRGQISNTLPRLQRHEPLTWDFRFVECRAERGRRRVNRFIRQLERAVMMGQRLLRAAIAERFDRVGWVHVLIAHEPARLIGPDRQDREPQRAVRVGDAAKMLASP